MSDGCLSQAEMVLAALGPRGTPADERVARHEADCASCREELALLREIVTVLQPGVPGEARIDACLDEATIARLADGLDLDRHRSEARHLIACARCRAELGAAVGVLHDPAVAAELQRLAARKPSWRRYGSHLPLAGGLVAAALAALVVGPALLRTPLERDAGADALRERTITTTAAPRIVGPVAAVTRADSLRWTSVPGADLYRVTVWTADGTVVFQEEVRDTVRASPLQITTSRERFLLWEVQARTGWDRWVSSDIAELTLTTPGVPR